MLELASLKFSVDTKKLETAANKLDGLVKKAGELGKVTKELAVAEKNLAVASKESAKASDLNASAELKLAKAREADAKANERNAKASKAVAETQVKQAESSQRIAAAQERQSKATKTVTDDSDRLIKLYSDLVSKANFVEQGFSRTEASLLTLATNLGATTGDVKDFAEAFDRIRKVIGGDPFDKSGSSLKRLQQELDISKKLTQSFGEAGALTKKQIGDLGRDLERTAALGKQFNLSQQEIEKEQNRIQKEFIETATALNEQNAALKRLERGSKDTADAHVKAYEKEQKARAQSVKSFGDYIDKVTQTKLATKELYSQGVFSRTTINQFVELERRAAAAGVSIETLNKLKQEFARQDAGNAGLKFQADLISGLTRQVLTLGAAYASVQGVLSAGGFFIKTADEMKLLKSRLDIAGEGTVNFKKNFGDLVKIANDARTPIESVTTVFTRLVPIMPAMGKGVKEATQVTEALTKMLRISGRGAQEASSAMLQFSQAMAKGKLDGDEFRSLAENLPEVLRVLERQTGKTRAEIMLMSSAGMLTATMMTDAMIASLGKLDAQLSKMPETVEGATTVLKNNFTLLIQKMDEATGISGKLAGAILSVAEGVKAVSNAGPGMTGLMTGLTTFVGSAAIVGIGSLAVNLGRVAMGYGAIQGAVAALTGFLRLNPIGLALLGLSAAAGYVSMTNAQKSQVTSLEEGKKKIASLTEEKKKYESVQLYKESSDRPSNKLYNDRIKGLISQKEDEIRALEQNLEAFKTIQTKTATEKFNASLTEAERASKNPLQLLQDSGFAKNSKEGLAQEWLKSNKEVQAGLSKTIKTAEFQYNQVVEEIKNSGLSPEKQKQKLSEAFGNLTTTKNSVADAANKTLSENQRKYDEALKSLNKKEAGPKRQASSEGYGIKNDGVIENLNKRYSSELKTIRDAENAKNQILESSGATGAELFQKRYQIMQEANDQESKLSAEHYTDVKNQTEKLIGEINAGYSRFVKEQSGREGFADANRKMAENVSIETKKLRDNLETLKQVTDDLNKRNEVALFKKLTIDVNEAGKAIKKVNDELVDLINKESELKAERDNTEQAQINSIGLTEQQVVMLKAETEERNRLNKEKQKIFADAEKAKSNLEGMIALQKNMVVVTDDQKVAADDLNSAIKDQEEKLKTLNATMQTYNGLLETLPQEQAARALRELNRKEVQEFSNKVADALNTGIFSGAKAGSKKLRQVIVDELKKPITVTVQALVSTAMNAITGSGANSVLGSVGNLLGLGKSANSISDFLGLGSLFGSGASGVGTGLTAGSLTGVSASFGSALGSATGSLSLLAETASASAVPSLAALGEVGFGSAAAIGEATGALTAGAVSNGLTLGASAATTASTGILASLGSVASMLGPIAAVAGIAKMIAGDYKLAGLGDLSFLVAPLARMFGMGSKKTTAQGISGTFDSSGFSGNSFQDWKQKGGLFRDDKKGTKLTALNSEADKSMDNSFALIKLQAAAIATQMNLATDSIFNFSKKVRVELGNNAEENNKKIQEMFDTMSDDMAKILIPSIDNLAQAGERAKDTFARLAQNLTTVNSVIGLLGVKLIDVSVVGATAASALAAMFGGLDKLKEATNVYYDAFYSQDEKMQLSLKVMQEAMKGVGLALPSTKEEFRKMVDVLDLNTEYGRNLYAVMVKIAPTFNEFTNSIEEVKTKVKDAASSLRDSIFGAKYGTMNSETQLSSLKNQFDELIAKAAIQSGSDLTATSEKISSSLQPLLDKVKDVYASGPEYFRLQDEILSKAGMIANRSDNLGTYEDRSLASLSDISGILSKINESGQLTVSNLQKLIEYGNKVSPVDTSSSNPTQTAIVKANNEASAIIGKLNAQATADSLVPQIAEILNQIESVKARLNDPLSNYGVWTIFEARKRAKDVNAQVATLSSTLNTLQNNQQYQQSIAGDISSQDTAAKLEALRAQIRAAGGVPAFAKGGAFTNGIVKEPTLFNMGMMGEAGDEGILPLARTSSGALGVQSVGVGSQELSDRLVESNKHLGALVRLQQASNIKIIEKLSEVEQRLEGIETAARLEASA